MRASASKACATCLVARGPGSCSGASSTLATQRCSDRCDAEPRRPKALPPRAARFYGSSVTSVAIAPPPWARPPPPPHHRRKTNRPPLRCSGWRSELREASQPPRRPHGPFTTRLKRCRRCSRRFDARSPSWVPRRAQQRRRRHRPRSGARNLSQTRLRAPLPSSAAPQSDGKRPVPTMHATSACNQTEGKRPVPAATGTAPLVWRMRATMTWMLTRTWRRMSTKCFSSRRSQGRWLQRRCSRLQPSAHGPSRGCRRWWPVLRPPPCPPPSARDGARASTAGSRRCGSAGARPPCSSSQAGGRARASTRCAERCA